MVDYKGQPIYMPRLCQTISFQLTEAEQHFYEEASEYLRWSYRNEYDLEQKRCGNGRGSFPASSCQFNLCHVGITETQTITNNAGRFDIPPIHFALR